MQGLMNITSAYLPHFYLPSVTVTVMAKPARPGLVKTRLIARYGAEAAAAVHAAMMHCVMARLRACFEPLLIDVRFVLALAEPYEDRDHPGGGWEIVSQGGGDLGERIGRVWHRIGLGLPFFSASTRLTCLGSILRVRFAASPTPRPLSGRRRTAVIGRSVLVCPGLRFSRVSTGGGRTCTIRPSAGRSRQG